MLVHKTSLKYVLSRFFSTINYEKKLNGLRALACWKGRQYPHGLVVLHWNLHQFWIWSRSYNNVINVPHSSVNLFVLSVKVSPGFIALKFDIHKSIKIDF